MHLFMASSSPKLSAYLSEAVRNGFHINETSAAHRASHMHTAHRLARKTTKNICAGLCLEFPTKPAGSERMFRAAPTLFLTSSSSSIFCAQEQRTA